MFCSLFKGRDVQRTIDTLAARRRILRFLTSFPLLTAGPRVGWGQSFQAPNAVLTRVDDVLSVMEFESLARAALPPAHFAYIATGVDDDRTVSINHEAFSRVRRCESPGPFDSDVGRGLAEPALSIGRKQSARISS
jgi:hypothetical protein